MDYERIQHQFDAYCKRVLRNAARDIYKRMVRQSKREISLSELSDVTAVMDEYFEEERQFEALGFSVAVKSELLAEALRLLPERQRDIILLSYFLELSDGKIGKMLNLIRSTVQYQRTRTLRELKKIMEEEPADERQNSE